MGTPIVSGVPSTGYVSQYFSDYPPVFSEALSKIEAIPGVVKVLQNVKAEGEISIGLGNISEQPAAWYLTERVITFKPEDIAKDTLSLADKIGLLIFEICNASRTSVFASLIEMIKGRKLNVEQYVEKVETMEFLSARQAHQLIEEGCKIGVITKDSINHHLSPIDDAKINYAYQQLNGHSLELAKRFQSMFPGEEHTYVGTVGHLSVQNRMLLNFLISSDYLFKNPSEVEKSKVRNLLQNIKASKKAEDVALCRTISSLFGSKNSFVGNTWTSINTVSHIKK